MGLSVCLICDACNKKSRHVHLAPNDLTVRGTLAGSDAASGWKRLRLGREMTDLCPECARKRLPETPRPLHRAVRPKLVTDRETIPFNGG